MDTIRAAVPLRLLYLADDSPDIAQVRGMLGRAAPPIEMDVVRTAAAACVCLQCEPAYYAWVLCDLILPGGEGLRVLEHARSLPLVAVAVADPGDPEAVARALGAGASDCIVRHGDYLRHLPRLLHEARARALSRATQPLRVLSAEDAVPAGERHWQRLAQLGPDVPFVLRWDGSWPMEVVLAGDGFAGLLGGGASVVARLGDRVHPTDQARFEQVLNQAARDLQRVRCEFRVRQSQDPLPGDGPVPAGDAGVWRRISLHMTPEREEPGAVLLYCHALDAAAGHEARAEFLSRMSHDLCTPLNAVLGFAQIIQADDDPPVSPAQRVHLRRIEQAGQHLVDMIDQALDLVRQPRQVPAPGRTHGAGSVLYAEDDEVNIEIVCGIISARTRLKLDVARSGAEAIRMAQQRPPDLLLLDIHLGDMDGIAVSNALRADPRLRDVPRIALSADASPRQVQRAREQGFADYLTKPVDVAALTACLERHLPPAGGSWGAASAGPVG